MYLVQVKKVIRDMTLGKDVSGLFTSVVNCMMVPNLEVRKLVYLYLINYAKTQPDLAIMAVNGFVKDCGDPNPLIRALAVRTMGCIRVEQISEYLCEPLRKALKDQDPYVRKTAAIAVAKLHEISPELVVDQGFIDSLNELLGDGNPMVVANSVAALAEIAYHGEPRALLLTNITVLKLLAVLNECNEWGQIFILDVMSTYSPESSSEAENIAERVKPRLQHANSAVVLSATKVPPDTHPPPPLTTPPGPSLFGPPLLASSEEKEGGGGGHAANRKCWVVREQVIIKLLDVIKDTAKIALLVKSLGPPLITLMSHPVRSKPILPLPHHHTHPPTKPSRGTFRAALKPRGEGGGLGIWRWPGGLATRGLCNSTTRGLCRWWGGLQMVTMRRCEWTGGDPVRGAAQHPADLPEAL